MREDMKSQPLNPQLTKAEWQTLERALEYGGEGGSLAILRTHSGGHTRYWQLERDYIWVNDDPNEVGRHLDFLGSDAEQALRASRYPWWLLVGLYVASDLRPIVAKILAELSEDGRNSTIESWLSSGDWDENKLEDLSGLQP